MLAASLESAGELRRGDRDADQQDRRVDQPPQEAQPGVEHGADLAPRDGGGEAVAAAREVAVEQGGDHQREHDRQHRRDDVAVVGPEPGHGEPYSGRRHGAAAYPCDHDRRPRHPARADAARAAPARGAARAARGSRSPRPRRARAMKAEIAYYRAHLRMGRDAAGLAALRRACAEVLRDALARAGARPRRADRGAAGGDPLRAVPRRGPGAAGAARGRRPPRRRLQLGRLAARAARRDRADAAARRRALLGRGRGAQAGPGDVRARARARGRDARRRRCTSATTSRPTSAAPARPG